MTKIIFVCTGNTCRSPMAKALFMQLGRANMVLTGDAGHTEEFEVYSAGLYTRDNLPATAEAIRTMRREGLDLSRHRSRQLDHELMNGVDLILTMSTSHRDEIRERYPAWHEMVFTLGEYAGYEDLEVSDPLGGGMEAYEQCARQLQELLIKVWAKLLQQKPGGGES